MHIYLFTMLVMHGLHCTHLPGTERRPGSLPQLEPGWGGGRVGVGWSWPLVGCSGGAAQNWCSNQQAKSCHYPSVCVPVLPRPQFTVL